MNILKLLFRCNVHAQPFFSFFFLFVHLLWLEIHKCHYYWMTSRTPKMFTEGSTFLSCLQNWSCWVWVGWLVGWMVWGFTYSQCWVCTQIAVCLLTETLQTFIITFADSSIYVGNEGEKSSSLSSYSAVGYDKLWIHHGCCFFCVEWYKWWQIPPSCIMCVQLIGITRWDGCVLAEGGAASSNHSEEGRYRSCCQDASQPHLHHI